MADAPTPWHRFSAALRRRPAALAAAVFIGGIALHAGLPHRPILFLIAAVVIASLAIRLSFARNMSVGIALFCCAVAAGQIEAFYFSPDDIAAYAGDQPRLAKLELEFDQPLRILGTPFAGAGARPLPPRQVTEAKVTRVLSKSGWQDSSGRILVQMDPPNDHLALGQRVRVFGMLQRPSPAMNPGQFDWAAYYREQRILTSIQIPHSDAIQIIETHTPTLLARARESVRRALAAGFTREQSLDHALLRALVLGDSDPELRDVQEQFRRTGTSHHLAISGMHVAVLGGVIYLICRLLLVRPRVAAWIGMIAVIVYGALALPSPPVWRSVLLCASFALGLMYRRSTDGVQLLALSVLAMLVYHPLDLYNAGFQLSFGTVLGLMLLSKRVEAMLRDPDEEAALNGGGKPDPSIVRRHRLRRWILVPLAVGVIAWLVSMPLIAYHFEQLNPWAVIASLLLAPFVFLSLIAGFLKILLTALLPFGAAWWATLAAWAVSLMRHAVDGLALLPGSDVPLPAKSILLIVLYYAILLLPLLPIVRPRIKFALRFSPIAAVLLLALLPLTGGAIGPSDGSLRVTMLAVGAGQCAVIEMPDGRVVLFDAGSATLTDPVRKCIGPFLRSRGHASVDEVWLSHGDFDHISAAAEIIRTYGVKRVVVSSEFEDLASGAADDALLETIRQRGLKLDHHHLPEREMLGKDVSVEILWPPERSALTSNNAGLVLKLTYARRTILFPADIQQLPENALLGHPDQLHCDVLIAPHHGSSEATTPAFVAAADPLYIVSSNDRTLSQKQRFFEYQIGGRPLFRTNRCGAVTIIVDRNGGLVVTPYLPQPESRSASASPQ
jgi:competence protein ComEC